MMLPNNIFLLMSFVFAGCLCYEYCDEKFSTKCYCGYEKYNNEDKYVVNCTATGFTNADMLKTLPQQTQVLIFTGNNVSELPLNVFGFNDNSNLTIIDMSSNNIKTIRGKSFHHVPNVERLILNHNLISISSDDPEHHHPRIFSNFESLRELHLTDAFIDNSPESLAADLHDIFFSSELKKLRKLHLEQNEISMFKDEKLFCDLPSLQQLYLGQNALSGIKFELKCLKSLTFLDLEQNLFYSFSEEDFNRLDELQRHHNFTIDIGDNPLTCNCDQLYDWLKTTQVEVRYKNKLHCRKSLQKFSPHCALKTFYNSQVYEDPAPNYDFLVPILICLLVLSMSFHAYTHRKFLKNLFLPTIQTVTKKVHYTTIGRPEEQEMEV